MKSEVHVPTPKCSIRICEALGTMHIIMYAATNQEFVEIPVCPTHLNLEPTRSDFIRVAD